GLDVRLHPGVLWQVPCVIVLCFVLGSGALLSAVVWTRPRGRPRALGLLSFLAAMASLALALGVGRYGFETRYVTLRRPAWCCLYFVWSIYAPPRLSVAARAFLLVLSLATLWPNTRFGLDYGAVVRSHLAGFEREMVAGTPGYRLVFRYWQYLHPHQDILNEY